MAANSWPGDSACAAETPKLWHAHRAIRSQLRHFHRFTFLSRFR